MVKHEEEQARDVGLRCTNPTYTYYRTDAWLIGAASLTSSLDIMLSTFLRDVSQNPANAAILARWDELCLPNAWLVAGCLFQTIWNLQSGRAPACGIKDYDVFYFDPNDLTATGEQRIQARVDKVLSCLNVTIEVANQARVHLWYEMHFGRPYPRLSSSEDGINRFLAIETCVGIRPGQYHAPYGLEGIYSGQLSPNPLTPYPELYADKMKSYCARWPHLVNAAADDASPLAGANSHQSDIQPVSRSQVGQVSAA